MLIRWLIGIMWLVPPFRFFQPIGIMWHLAIQGFLSRLQVSENSCTYEFRLDFLTIGYREDESRIREEHLRENFAWLNRFTLYC